MSLAAPFGLHAWLRASRGAGPTPVETCAAIQAMLDPAESIVAITLEGSRLDRHLLASVPPHRLFRYLLDEPAAMADQPLRGPGWNAPAPAIRLGAHDRDMPPPPPLPWPAPPPLPARRYRRLDTLHARDRVGLIVAETPEALFDALAGAPALLREQPPALLLDLAGVTPAERPALLRRAMAATGAGALAWHDGLLLPCADEPAWRERLLQFADRVACALPARLRPPLPPGAPAGADIARDTLAWLGWQSPVRADETRRAGLGTSFDDAMPVAGFHYAETDGHGWWRWTGPARRAAFALPVSDAGRWTLRLDVFAWGTVRDADDVQLFADGIRLEPMPAEGAPLRFGVIAIPAAMPRGRVRIDLVCRSVRRASESDERQVGICLTRATLERVG
jgi:hypothetical protein